MPAPVLEQEQWEEVEAAFVLGVPAPELAKKFGIEENAIHQRSFRFKWLSPKRLQKMQDELKRQRQAEGVIDYKETPTAGGIVAEKLQEYVSRTQLAVLEPLTKGLEESMLTTPKSFQPRNLKELSQLVGVTWKLTNQDKPQFNLQTNVLNWTNHSTELPQPVQMAQDVTEESGEDERVLNDS